MYIPAPELFNSSEKTVVLPVCAAEGLVDHPSSWLELLETIPTSAPNGRFAAAIRTGAGSAGHATITSVADAVVDHNALQARRQFDIEVADETIKFSATCALSVKATADHLALVLRVSLADELVLSEPIYAAWLAFAVVALGEQIRESVALMHSRLTADLAETDCELTLAMPNAQFGAIQALCLDQLKAGAPSAACACSIRYVGAFADAIPAPTAQKPAKESTRISLSTEQRLALALNLSTLREARGFSQLEVAFQALGFSKSHAAVSRLERGILNEVEGERLKKLAAFYDTTSDALLGNKTVSSATSAEVAPEAKGLKSIFDPDSELAPAAYFGNRLTLARTSAGLSQSALSRRLGHVNDSLVKDWEAETVTPRRVTFIDLATELEVPVSWLMFGRRSETPARGIGLRLTAMQKLYHLSNSELAALMENTDDISTVEHTGKLLHRISRGRSQPAPEVLERLARVLQVPPDWISPPSAEVAARRAQVEAATQSQNVALNQQGEQLKGLNKSALKLVTDLIDLIQMGVIEDKDFRTLREDLIAKYTTPYIRRGRKASTEALAA